MPATDRNQSPRGDSGRSIRSRLEHATRHGDDQAASWISGQRRRRQFDRHAERPTIECDLFDHPDLAAEQARLRPPHDAWLGRRQQLPGDSDLDAGCLALTRDERRRKVVVPRRQQDSVGTSEQRGRAERRRDVASGLEQTGRQVEREQAPTTPDGDDLDRHAGDRLGHLDLHEAALGGDGRRRQPRRHRADGRRRRGVARIERHRPGPRRRSARRHFVSQRPTWTATASPPGSNQIRRRWTDRAPNRVRAPPTPPVLSPRCESADGRRCATSPLLTGRSAAPDRRPRPATPTAPMRLRRRSRSARSRFASAYSAHPPGVITPHLGPWQPGRRSPDVSQTKVEPPSLPT